jgi:uncharacterized damage-inducible protein DinB
MNPILRDMLGHQFWADTELWNAIGAHAAARGDKVIRDRLHHIHVVQRAFIWALGDRAIQFDVSEPEAFTSFETLASFGRQCHEDFGRVLAGVDDAHLADLVSIPWFQNPPLTITVAEALTQCAMHSHYHRGQNATRLRELGGEPPPTDLIVWLWKERPPPRYETS